METPDATPVDPAHGSETRPPQTVSTGIQIGAGTRVDSISVQGDVAGRDIVNITEELTYEVGDLVQNPYLGLASYTYATRAFYSGREQQTSEAILRLTTPGEESVLLFVTGASGSGKSSFAQAGLVPALEDAYRPRGRFVRLSVIRPGRHPMAALARALEDLQLGAPANADWAAILRTPDDLNHVLATQTPSNQINVVVIDQFEELFTQADASERDTACGLLSGLAPVAQIRTHIIATLRADYLSALFNVPALFEVAKKAGVELRAMQSGELARAIRRPIEEEARREGKTKRLDPALVERLVEDVDGSPSLLPLLQVTLTSLWDEPPHRLTLDRYRSLTDALEQQAERVYTHNRLGQERPIEECQQLMAILLDLVEVSLDDDARRDVRHTVSRVDLVGGHPERSALIDELVEARLLAGSVVQVGDTRVEMVDIVHETLLTNWPRLRSTIAEQREALQQRERFRLNLREWLQNARSTEYLLEGVRLAEARKLAERGDIALQNADARALLDQSNAAEAAERTRALREAQRRQRVLAGVAGLAVLLAFAALGGAGAALSQANIAQTEATARATAEADAIAQRDEARTQEQLANSRELASSALAQLAVDPELSVLLAEQAAGVARTSEAENALRQSLLESRVRATIRLPGGIHAADISPDGARVVAVGADGSVAIWDISNASHPLVLQGHTDQVTQAWFSTDGRRVATASKDGTARVWDSASGDEQVRFEHGAAVQSVAFNAANTQLLTRSADGKTRLWDLASKAEVRTFQAAAAARNQQKQTMATAGARFVVGDTRILAVGDDGLIHVWDAASGNEVSNLEQGIVVSPNGAREVLGSDWDTARLWDTASGQTVATLTGDHDASQGAILRRLDAVSAFSPDGSRVVIAGMNGGVRVWDAGTGVLLKLLEAHSGAVTDVAFSSDGQRVVTAGSDGTVNVSSLTGNTLTLRGHTGAVVTARFDAIGDRVLSVSEDGSTRVWELPTVLGDGEQSVEGVALSPDATRLLLTAGNDNTLAGKPVAQVWDTTTGRKLSDASALSLEDQAPDACTPALPFGIVDTPPHVFAALSPRGAHVVTSTGIDAEAEVWDPDTGRVQSKCLPSDIVKSVAFSPGGEYAYVQTKGGLVQAWEAVTGHNLNLPRTAQDVAFSSDGSRAVLAGQAGANVWDVRSQQTVLTLAQGQPVHAPRLSPDGSWLAAGVGASTVQVWDLRSGQQVTSLSFNGTLSELTFNAAGTRLLAFQRAPAGGAQSLAMWDVATGQQLEALDGVSTATFGPDGSQVLVVLDSGNMRVGAPGALHDLANATTAGAAMLGATFNPDGSHIVSWHRDGAVRVWDVVTGAEVIALRDHIRAVTTVAVSQDGTHLVSADEDGTVRVYGCEVTCSFDGLLDLAHGRVTRELTDVERQRYLHTQ